VAFERVCKQGQASTLPPQYIVDMLECHNCWANFWKFYLTRTSFTLGEPFSLVNVFRLFRLDRIFLVFRVWTQYIDVEHLIYWQGQCVCDALLDIEIDIVGGWKCLHIMGFFNLLHLFGRTLVLTVNMLKCPLRFCTSHLSKALSWFPTEARVEISLCSAFHWTCKHCSTCLT
jgi:hypothetical protein